MRNIIISGQLERKTESFPPTAIVFFLQVTFGLFSGKHQLKTHKGHLHTTLPYLSHPKQ
jgi:hypothetical protein